MDLKRTHLGGGYGSEFEYDSESERKKRSRQDLATKGGQNRVTGGLPSKRLAAEEYDREESKNQRFHFLALDAYNRHKQLINDYILYYPGATKDLFKRDASKDKTDLDVIRENHRFLWGEGDGGEEEEDSWGKRLAKKYWDKLFKEYCIVDLSRYKENKIAMRWRIEKEVMEGKGHFTCGNKKCDEQTGLRTWEVNFGYVEHGEKKNALVKLRLCERCSHKLNYHKKCKEVTKKASAKEKASKSQTSRSPSPTGSSPSKHRHKDTDKVKHKDTDKVKHKDSHKSRRKDSRKEKHKKRHHKEKKHKKKRRSSSEFEESAGEERDERRTTSKHQTQDDGTSVSESDFWSGPAPVIEDKSREDEMDDFLNGMFL